MGYTLLYSAVVLNDDHDVTRMLSLHDADMHIRNNNGYTPLVGAVRFGNAEIVETLLDYGGKKEETFMDRTAYDYALDSPILSKNKEILENLKPLEKGKVKIVW